MKYLITIVYILSFFFCQAQFSKYPNKGEKVMRFAVFHGKITNEWSQKVENESHSAFVIDIGNSRSTFGNFKFQSSHRYKILGDVISMLYTEPGYSEKPTPGTPVITSVVGWHNYGISLYSTNYFQLSVGGHLGDYFYGIEGLHESNRKSPENTSGTINYYGGVGPVLFVDLALFDSGLFFHYEGSYAFTFGETPVLPDVQPKILNQMFELRWNNLYLNLEIVNGLNTTGNRIVRRQLGIGISI
ncbi:MAG TPA: hypothetical protein PKL31_14695 [Fulvivirga sp.]|nr:hypothetical protein [Fulvivirga sp.]